MIVRFVGVGGIVDHHCLNFLFKMLYVYIIRLFRIISIPSKFCYFRPPDHVISMD